MIPLFGLVRFKFQHNNRHWLVEKLAATRLMISYINKDGVIWWKRICQRDWIKESVDEFELTGYSQWSNDTKKWLLEQLHRGEAINA